MTLPIIVAVPFRHRQQEAEKLALDFAAQGAESVYLIANQSIHPRRNEERKFYADRDVRDFPMHDKTLHEMWNFAWAEARDQLDGKPGMLLVANDDISIPPHLLWWLRKGLETLPDCWVVSPDPRFSRPFEPFSQEPHKWSLEETHGVGRCRPELPQGGITGWCFAVRTDAPLSPLVHPDLAWWRGDDWVIRETWRLGGKCAYVSGIGVGHLLSATLGPRLPELQPQIDRDEALWRALTEDDK